MDSRLYKDATGQRYKKRSRVESGLFPTRVFLVFLSKLLFKKKTYLCEDFNDLYGGYK